MRTLELQPICQKCRWSWTWVWCPKSGQACGIEPFNLWDLMLAPGRLCQNWIELLYVGWYSENWRAVRIGKHPRDCHMGSYLTVHGNIWSLDSHAWFSTDFERCCHFFPQKLTIWVNKWKNALEKSIEFFKYLCFSVTINVALWNWNMYTVTESKH